MRLEELNEKQKEAVLKTEGPMLILAGAGSGKTKTLTFKIAYLLEQKLAHPNEILAVTFTNKAAEEMKNRVRILLNPKEFSSANAKYNLPFMGTFHSICVKILRMEALKFGINPNFVIYDTDDQENAVKEVMFKLNISPKEFNPKAILSNISSCKNELIGPEEYDNFAQGYFQQIVSRVYKEYKRYLEEANAYDFDDLLFKTIMYLKGNKEILEKYQKNFKYILVDEYQDTNHAQYILISLFSKINGNICVVGDEDQSIYKFRGSDIRNILNFERDYPKAVIVKLEQNYRSTKNILAAANSVIKHNSERRDKKMWTDNKEGAKITIYQAENEKDEAWWIIRQIEELEKDQTRTISILYRTNAQSRNIEEALIKAGHPYKLVGGFRFYERKEVKDIIAYMRLINNPKDTLSLTRIINTPRRGIGKKSLELLSSLSENRKLKAGEIILKEEFQKELDNKLKEFSSLIIKLEKLTHELKVGDLISEILEETKYLEFLDDKSDESKSRIENVKEFSSVAQKYSNLNPRDSLNELLTEIALIEANDEKGKEEKSQITLMTVHAAKGLEFDNVFVIGMEEGIFPHSRSFVDPSEMEEERRLAYVALTRAKREICLIYTESRLYFGSRQANPISRFIEDIPEDYLEKKSYEDNLLNNLNRYTQSSTKRKYVDQSKSLSDDWAGWDEDNKENKYGNYI